MNMTTNQLNPYAIALCSLGRWISARQWVPAGSGSFSIRTSGTQALITPHHKDKAELSPQDLQPLCWPSSVTATEPAAVTHQLHAGIYQQVTQAKVVLQVQSSSALLFSKLVQSSQHQFVGYQLQHVLQQNQHQDTVPGNFARCQRSGPAPSTAATAAAIGAVCLAGA